MTKEKDIKSSTEVVSKRQRLSPVNQNQKQKKEIIIEPVITPILVPVSQPEIMPVAPKVVPLKLPYPVLNDKRDMKIILGTLETKRNELIKKRDVNLQNLKVLNKKKQQQILLFCLVQLNSLTQKMS